MGFRVKVAPMVRNDKDGRWIVPIILDHTIGSYELFASAYGPSKEIALMRAELLAAAINKGVGNVEL